MTDEIIVALAGANISALLRNIHLVPQTQSKMECNITEVGIRSNLRNRTKVIYFVH